jgi:hypothetical protein
MDNFGLGSESMSLNLCNFKMIFSAMESRIGIVFVELDHAALSLQIEQ